MNDYDIIKLFKKRAGITSDYQAAKKLRISRTVISDIRNGRKHISENIVITMTRIAGREIAHAYAASIERRIMDIM